MRKLFIFLLLCLPGLNFAQTPEDLRAGAGDYSISIDDFEVGQIPAETAPQPVDKVNDAYVSGIFSRISFLNKLELSEINVRRSGKLIVIESTFKDYYSDVYKNGDVSFLTGYLEDQWTQAEWNRFYGIAKWLVKHNFRVIMNPVAYIPDIRATVQDPRTKVIIWSSHGSKDGRIYDSRKEAVPAEIFAENAGANFKQIIASSCYGEVMVQRYAFPERVNKKYWQGTTGSDDLFNYLKSDSWNPLTLGENVY